MKKENKRKRGRRVLTVLLLILVVVIAAVVAVVVWQKNNIEALKLYITQSRDDIESQIAQNDEYMNELLEKYLSDIHSDDVISETTAVTDTAEVQINTSEIDVSDTETEPAETDKAVGTEAVDDRSDETTVATGSKSEQTPAVIPKPDETSSQTEAVTEAPRSDETSSQTEPVTEAPRSDETSSQTEAPKPVQTETDKAAGSDKADMTSYESELKAIIAEVYALREEFTKALDTLYDEAVAAYKAVPKDEWTSKKLAGFINEYLGKGTALEKECDGKMDDIIKELRALTKKYGQSTEIIDSVKYAYAREKSLKKAWYMSELERRGFI